MNRKRILIISMTAGSGHVRAAKSILDYALSNISDAKIEHIDFSKLISPAERLINQHLYEFLSKKMPALWGWYYKITNSSRFAFYISERLMRIQSLFQKYIVKAALEQDPDIIIFTNPIPAHLIAKKIFKISKNKIKIAMVVTDYHTHRIYNIPNVNYYFVACGEAKYDLIKIGIPEEKIVVSGIPINPRFYIKQDVTEIKSKYKLNKNLQTILFITSSLPKRKVMSVINILEKFKNDFNIIIITAGDKKLYNKIKKDFSEDVFLLVDWTDVIDEYMKVSDIIIGKPGGLVSSECMALNKKLFIVGFIPGVEQYNARYMEKNNFAEVLLSGKELSKRLSEIANSKNVSVRENLTYKSDPSKVILEKMLSDK